MPDLSNLQNTVQESVKPLIYRWKSTKFRCLTKEVYSSFNILFTKLIYHIHKYGNMWESLEAGQWWDVYEDVKGQYYDLQLFCGCRCGVSTAAQSAKRSLATTHNTDENCAHHSPAAILKHVHKRGIPCITDIVRCKTLYKTVETEADEMSPYSSVTVHKLTHVTNLSSIFHVLFFFFRISSQLHGYLQTGPSCACVCTAQSSWSVWGFSWPGKPTHTWRSKTGTPNKNKKLLLWSKKHYLVHVPVNVCFIVHFETVAKKQGTDHFFRFLCTRYNYFYPLFPTDMSDAKERSPCNCEPNVMCSGEFRHQ